MQVVVIGVAAAGDLPVQRGAHVAGRKVHQRQCMQRARCLIQPRRLHAEFTPQTLPSTKYLPRRGIFVHTIAHLVL